MEKSYLHSAYQILVSTFVAFVLLFQTVISLGPIAGIEIGTQYWPLLNYAMYSRSFHEGDTVNVYRPIEVVTADGVATELTLDDLDLQLWHYRILGTDLENGNQDALDFLLAKVASGSAVTEIRIRSFPVVVTRAGPELHDSEILVRIGVLAGRFRK